MRATAISKREKFYVRFIQAVLIILLVLPILGIQGLKLIDIDIDNRYILAPSYLLLLWLIYFIGPVKIHYNLTGIVDIDDRRIVIKDKQNIEANIIPAESLKLEFCEIHKKGIDLRDTYFVDLKVTAKDGEVTKLKFYINTKAQINSLKSVLETWYKNKYPVKEFMETGARNFLLKQNPSYVEIQKIKEEYGIEWV